jgi:SlyX protein
MEGCGVEKRWQNIEEAIAHLTSTVDDLSGVVARQAAEIDVLTRRVALLMLREAEREADMGGAQPVADQKPPHW